MQVEVTTKRGLIGAAIAIALTLVLTGGGYVVGRHFTPPNTVIQTEVKVKEVEKQVVVTQTKIQTEVKVVKVADRDNNIHRTYLIEEKPDGTKITRVIEDDKSEINVRLSATKGDTVTNNTHTDTVKETVRTEEKVTQSPKSKWRAGAMVGWHVPGLWGNHTSNIVPFEQDLVLGASIERRLIGPLSLGIWGTSTKDAGLSLHVEW